MKTRAAVAFEAKLPATAGTLLAGIRMHYAGPVHIGRDLASFDVGCG